LHCGTFDGSNELNVYRKGKQSREVEPWKERHFEKFWGQLSLVETLLKEPPPSKPKFSYTDVTLPESALILPSNSEVKVRKIR